MKIEITYPSVAKRTLQRRKLLHILRWPIWLIAYTSPILNLMLGGEAWSLIVLIGLYILWRFVLSPDLVEYNRISQSIKLTCNACVLLGLIDALFSFGWAFDVIPIVSFGGLAMSGILFFTDFQKQKQNMLPMLLMIFLNIVGSIIGLSLWFGVNRWAYTVMGALALALIFAFVVLLGRDFLLEFRKRFHVR